MTRLPWLVLLLVSLAARQVRAEEPPPTDRGILETPRPAQGYYYTLGLAGGLANVRDDDRMLPVLGNYAAALRIGQSVYPWMDLGVCLDVGVMHRNERTGTLIGFGIDWTLHPIGNSFVRLGVSFGASRLSAAKNSDDRASAFGTLPSITVGYAFFPFADKGQSGGFAISPVVRFQTIQPFNEDAAFWSTVGFEITRWSGLPVRQLDMSLTDAFGKKRDDGAH